MYQNILTSVTDRILIITIHRESKLNALNKDTLHQLHLAFKEAFGNKEIAGVIVTGAGNKAFVAGADISELIELDHAAGYQLAKDAHTQVFNLIAGASKPVIAAINGYALGGGLELALACHMRIASENAWLGLPEVSLGLIPGYGGTQRLPQLIGKAKALEMILTAEKVTARQALEFGLVNQVVPNGEALKKAILLMQKILRQSPIAVSAAIRAVNASNGEFGYETEIKEFSNCFGSVDFQEGTQAFLQKREPQFGA